MLTSTPLVPPVHEQSEAQQPCLLPPSANTHSFVAHICCDACRRLSALAGAATAVKSAMTALNTLMSGGDDQNGGPVQCNLLIQAAAAVPEQTSLPMQAIQTIESSLTYPEPTAKASWYSALHVDQSCSQFALCACLGLTFPVTLKFGP